MFTERLGCAELLLSLVDEGRELGKSPLLVGLIWILYTSCWIFYTQTAVENAPAITVGRSAFRVRLSYRKPSVVGGSG